MIESHEKGHLNYLRFHVAKASPDPSTKVACNILSPQGHGVQGVNRPLLGFFAPHLTVDQIEHQLAAFSREERMKIMRHAEEVAILAAGPYLCHGATLYVGAAMACLHCAPLLIEAGIKRVVALGWGDPAEEVLQQQWERWGCAEATALLRRCGVLVELVRNPG